MPLDIEKVKATLKKIPPIGWVAIVGGLGVAGYYFYNKEKTSTSTDTSGITSADQGLALSNLAGMPFDSLNPTSDNTSGTTSDYVPATGNTTDTSGGNQVAAPALSSIPTDTSSSAGVPASPVQSTASSTSSYYSSQNTPGESVAAITKAYNGCVANCIKNEKLPAVHCQQKCAIRHPIPMGGGGVSGFDDWSQIHDDFHYDEPEWIHHLVGHANPNYYDREANSHAIGGGGHMGHNMPQINFSRTFGKQLTVPGDYSDHVSGLHFTANPGGIGSGNQEEGGSSSNPDNILDWFNS